MSKSARQALWPRRHPGVQIALYAVVASAVASVVMFFVGTGKPGPAAVGASARDAAATAQATSSPAAVGTSTSASPAPSASTSASPAPSSTALTTTNTAQVATWEAGTGGTALQSVSVQLGNVVMAHGANQFVEMKKACTKLATAVTTAQAGPAIPDTAMQLEYQGSLTNLATAAADCNGAISYKQDGDEHVVATENATTLSQATSALVTGAKDLYVATYTIKQS